MKNKTAYILGGLGLIGREISRAFTVAGAKTIVLDLNCEKATIFQEEMRDTGYDIHFKFFDCADMENIEQNFTALLKENGCPDIFINCSYPRTKDWSKNTFKDITLKSFRENIDIHMNSYAWLARLAAEAMVISRTKGSIVQIGSIYGVVGQDLTVYEGTDMKENITYAAIKGGITNLSRQMAAYYGNFNIRVNTVCPGGIKGHTAAKSDKQNPVFVKQYCKKVPLKRLGLPEEIASTALFLASEASSYITGATIMVDGGWTAI